MLRVDSLVERMLGSSEETIGTCCEERVIVGREEKKDAMKGATRVDALSKTMLLWELDDSCLPIWEEARLDRLTRSPLGCGR